MIGMVLAGRLQYACGTVHWWQASHLIVDTLPRIDSILATIAIISLILLLNTTLSILVFMNSFFPRQVFGRSHLKLWYLVVKVVLQVRSIYIEVVHCLLG